MGSSREDRPWAVGVHDRRPEPAACDSVTRGLRTVCLLPDGYSRLYTDELVALAGAALDVCAIAHLHAHTEHHREQGKMRTEFLLYSRVTPGFSEKAATRGSP